MNVLLWRLEYAGKAPPGSSLPAGVVWQKMLTAPDSSSLTVFHRGKKIGFCHWLTSVSQQLNQVQADEEPPEGMLGHVTNYRVQIEGNLALDQTGERLRFDGHLSLDRKRAWQECDLRINFRPETWQVHASSLDQNLRINGQNDGSEFNRIYTFSELQHPEILLQDLAGPAASGWLQTLQLLAGAGFGVDTKGISQVLPQNTSPGRSLPNPLLLLGMSFSWDARHDSVKIGRSSAPAYRLRTQFMNRYQAVVFVSRVGEILRVELPGEVVLVNDQMAGF
jgi:hypothetical protein